MTKLKAFAVLRRVLLASFTIGIVIAAPAIALRLTPASQSLIAGLLGGMLAVALLWTIEHQSYDPIVRIPPHALDGLIARVTWQMTAAVVICDIEGKIIWVNDAFSIMTGFSGSEVIGQMPGHFMQGKETDLATVALIKEHILNEVPLSCDILNYKKDGSSMWIRLDIRQVRNSLGQVEALFGSQTDITERKQYEINRDRQLREALAAADLDPLTGLLNHLAFHNHLRARAIDAKQNGLRLGLLMIDLDNFKFFNEAYGHTVGDQVLRQVADTLVSASVGFGFECAARFGGDEFALLVSIPTGHEIEIQPKEIENLFEHLGYRPDGYDRPIPISVSVGISIYPDDGQVSDLLSAADQRLMRAKLGAPSSPITSDLRHAVNGISDGFSMLDALVTAVDNKDRYTRRHSEDVLGYALKIADTLGFDAATKNVLAVAALLHDVGKIGVPDRILRKPGPLTEEEFLAVKQHPQMGAAIVGAVSGFEDTLETILFHHERWDGKGYPEGREGTDIPPLARLMAVADGISAMTTDRPYRKGMSQSEAYAILANGSGTQWDPEIVDALIRVHLASAA